jgi:hypothetical protein
MKTYLIKPLFVIDLYKRILLLMKHFLFLNLRCKDNKLFENYARKIDKNVILPVKKALFGIFASFLDCFFTSF